MLENRPDLSHVSAEVRAYIEALESRLLEYARPAQSEAPSAAATSAPSEPATTQNVVVFTRRGWAKRTPRHFFSRQRRAGMGVFGIGAVEADPPALLVLVDAADTLLLLTNEGRAFRLPVSAIVETAIDGKAQPLTRTLPLREGEYFVAAVSADMETDTYLALISERGFVRRIRAPYFSKRMIQGMTYHNVKEGGALAGACWTPGAGDVLVASQSGLALRFSAAQIPTNGVLGMRLAPEDTARFVLPTDDDGGVLFVGHDGKGSIRLMSGFRRNKAPTAGGKIALKTDRLIGALPLTEAHEIFLLSQSGKIIRFAAAEIPPKTGAVQGVNLMQLRNDETVAVAGTIVSA